MRLLSIKKLSLLVAFIIGLHLMFIYKSTLVIVGKQLLFVKIYIALTGLFLLSRFLIIIFYFDKHTKKFHASQYPSVSFVIAAKNEGDSIFKTISTCMESEYEGKMECIVVDDGSTDDTNSEMLRAAEYHEKIAKKVDVITFKKNRGKREAMAEGILHATGDVIVFVDSDSFIAKDATQHIVEHFMLDSKIGAVAGNTGVENSEVNILTKMQSARYGVSFDIFKACESVFGVVTCCPGCFSAYKRDALLPVLNDWREQKFLGTKSTFGDDRSLTNFVLKSWKVVYCRSAKAETIAPENYTKFLNQQLRWKKSWIREGVNAAKFFWKKNIIASSSFYINLLIPICSPVIVFYALFVEYLIFHESPIVFLIGIGSLSFLYGLFYFWHTSNKYWWYLIPFTFFYTFVLVWQMPYALFRLRDTKWGTR